MVISMVSDMWLNPREEPFEIIGLPWLMQYGAYRRLPPGSAEPQIPLDIDGLADCTAGGQIRFTTNSTRILVRVLLGGLAYMNHMPATGQCGFDCYVGASGNQRFTGCAKYDIKQDNYECLLFKQDAPAMREVTLNFPLYIGVKNIMVGLDAGSEAVKPAPLKNHGRCIFYGTSITQGGCASRPGLAYTNIISRLLGIECVNLGFSGCGRGEEFMARLMASIPDPACYILDYEANVNAGMMQKTLPGFIEVLRTGNPGVPLLLASRIRFAQDGFLKESAGDSEACRKIQSDAVKAIGGKDVAFLDGSRILGSDFDECTVDGVHPNDIGFMRIARAFAPVMADLMQMEALLRSREFRY